MAELIKVNAPVRKPLFEGVQGENEARSIQFDVTPWVEELGDGAVTATAKRSQDSKPYPVTVTKDGTTVTWKPTSTDTAFAGVGSFQLEYTVDSVLAKTCIWSTMVAPSLDPAGDPPDPYDNWLAEMRQVAADALQSEQNAEDSAEDAEAWAVGQRGGVDVPSTDPTYENNAKYWAEQSAENQYGAFIVKSASGDIASFADGADNVPMKSLNVTITPKQAGSGDPSPSNVRPITGTSTENVTVTGKNMFDSARFLDATNWTESGGVYTGDSDRIAYNKGSGLPYLFKFDNPTAGQYSISLDAMSNKINRTGYVLFKYSDGTQSAAIEIVGNTWTHYSWTSTAGKTVTEVVFLGSNSTVLSIKNFQLETGNTATTYEPYTGHTTPVPLGQTVYGGEVDVTTGVLTVYPYYSSYNGEALAGRWVCNKAKYVEGTTPPTGSQVVDMSGTVATTYNLTPTEVRTLLGTNNVWADCGSVAVEYRADPTLAYNELANVIVSLGGNL